MNPDLPVKIEKEDLLNRYTFAKEIVQGILKSFKSGQDSVVVGINGEWGCGKTSLLEFIKSEILIQTKKDPYRNPIYEFNPWSYHASDDLFWKFLSRLGVILGNYNREYERLKNDFNRIVDTIEILNEVNPEVKSKVVFKGLKKLINILIKPTTIEQLKNEANERLADNNIKLFIFIDDLDRCTPNEISQIFQVVKVNANFRNTIFFIAYDKEIVVNALNKEYGKNGDKYLEKIVQIDYLLPKVLPEKLKSLFHQNVSNFNDKFKINIEIADIEKSWDSGLKNYFTSLRHMYRLINALELRITKIFKDVNPFDFLILESIRIFDYSAYEWIYRHREDLLYEEIEVLMPTGVTEESNKSLRELVINHKELTNAKFETKNLICRLFDMTQTTTSNGMIVQNDRNIIEDLNRNKNIASKDYFDHYFSFEVSPQNLSYRALKDFLRFEPNRQKELLNANFENEKLDKFLDQLSDNLMNEHFKTKLDIIKLLLDHSDEQHYEAKKTGKFQTNLLDLVLRSVTKICKSISKIDEKKEILNIIISGPKESYSRFYLTDQINFRLTEGKVFPETEFFPDEILNSETINNNLADRINYFGDQVFSDPFRFEIGIVKYFLVRYHQFYPSAYLKEINRLLNDPNSTMILFRCSLTQMTVTGRKEFGYSISDKHILPELTIEKFEEVLTKIDDKNLNEENLKYYELFQKFKETKFNPNMVYSLELEDYGFL